MKILEVSQGLVKRKLKKAHQQKKQARQKEIQVINQRLEKQDQEIAKLNQPGNAYNLVVEKLQESAKDAELQELKAFRKQVLAKPIQHRKKKNSFMHYGDDPNGS